MNKIILVLACLIFACPVSAVGNKVELREDMRVKLNDTNQYLTIKNGSIFDRIIVNSNNIEILTGVSDSVIIQSEDRKILSNNSNLATVCPSGNGASSLTINNYGDTIIIPSVDQCLVQSGGGGGVNYCSAVTYSNWGPCVGGYQLKDILARVPYNCSLTTAQQISLQRSCTLESIKAQPVILSEHNEQKMLENILNEAKAVSAGRAALLEYIGRDTDLASEQSSLIKYKNILSSDKSLGAGRGAIINNFIIYGTPSTLKLGTGERAGVINSYFQAYGKLPDTEQEWSDAIKIANGRWTTERSVKAETQAKLEFNKVYSRNANLNNNHDENAIMVMAYGLIPSQRNLINEKTAIKTFRSIYRRYPANALTWNVIRAVAYSGAKK